MATPDCRKFERHFMSWESHLTLVIHTITSPWITFSRLMLVPTYSVLFGTGAGRRK